MLTISTLHCLPVYSEWCKKMNGQTNFQITCAVLVTAYSAQLRLGLRSRPFMGHTSVFQMDASSRIMPPVWGWLQEQMTVMLHLPVCSLRYQPNYDPPRDEVKWDDRSTNAMPKKKPAGYCQPSRVQHLWWCLKEFRLYWEAVTQKMNVTWMWPPCKTWKFQYMNQEGDIICDKMNFIN